MNTRSLFRLLGVGLLLAAPLPALAQGTNMPGNPPGGMPGHGPGDMPGQGPGSMPGHGPGGMPDMRHDAPAAQPGASQAYRDAMMKMHRDMDVPMTGNADRDFVTGMIPHHQGAIDMAEVELRYGRDPQLRRLARDIIAAQKREIAGMRQWLARHPQ